MSFLAGATNSSGRKPPAPLAAFCIAEKEAERRRETERRLSGEASSSASSPPRCDLRDNKKSSNGCVIDTSDSTRVSWICPGLTLPEQSALVQESGTIILPG